MGLKRQLFAGDRLRDGAWALVLTPTGPGGDGLATRSWEYSDEASARHALDELHSMASNGQGQGASASARALDGAFAARWPRSCGWDLCRCAWWAEAAPAWELGRKAYLVHW